MHKSNLPIKPFGSKENNDICRRYEQGQRIGSIARRYKCDSKRIRKVLQKEKMLVPLNYQLDPKEFPFGRISGQDPMGWQNILTENTD